MSVERRPGVKVVQLSTFVRFLLECVDLEAVLGQDERVGRRKSFGWSEESERERTGFWSRIGPNVRRRGRESRIRGPATGPGPPATGADPRTGPRARRRPRRRPGHRPGRLGHDHPARPRAPPRARPDREGPRRRGRDRGELPLRARLHRQVDPDAGREDGDRRGRCVARGARHGHRDLGRHDDLRAGARARGRPGPDGADQLRPGRGRALQGRPPGPDGHPERRRSDAVGRPRRPVRRRGDPLAPRGHGLHGHARHGSAIRPHHAEHPRGRDQPGPDRVRPAAGRPGRPHQVGHRSASARWPASRTRTPSSPTPASSRRPATSSPPRSAGSSLVDPATGERRPSSGVAVQQLQQLRQFGRRPGATLGAGV